MRQRIWRYCGFVTCTFPICLLLHPRDIEYVLVTNPGNFTKSADYRALARVLVTGCSPTEGTLQHQRSLIQPAFRRENILRLPPPVMTAPPAACSLPGPPERISANIHEDMMAVTWISSRNACSAQPSLAG